MVYPQLAPADGNTRERSVLGPSRRLPDCRTGLPLRKRPGWAEIPLRPCNATSWSLQGPPVLTGDSIRCSRLFGEVGHYAPVIRVVSNAFAKQAGQPRGPPPLARSRPPCHGWQMPPLDRDFPGRKTDELVRACRPGRKASGAPAGFGARRSPPVSRRPRCWPFQPRRSSAMTPGDPAISPCGDTLAMLARSEEGRRRLAPPRSADRAPRPRVARASCTRALAFLPAFSALAPGRP